MGGMSSVTVCLFITVVIITVVAFFGFRKRNLTYYQIYSRMYDVFFPAACGAGLPVAALSPEWHA